jgi:hypothetical protein
MEITTQIFAIMQILIENHIRVILLVFDTATNRRLHFFTNFAFASPESSLIFQKFMAGKIISIKILIFRQKIYTISRVT